MAGLTEFYCGWNEPSHASQFKWLEYTFKWLFMHGNNNNGNNKWYMKQE